MSTLFNWDVSATLWLDTAQRRVARATISKPCRVDWTTHTYTHQYQSKTNYKAESASIYSRFTHKHRHPNTYTYMHTTTPHHIDNRGKCSIPWFHRIVFTWVACDSRLASNWIRKRADIGYGRYRNPADTSRCQPEARRRRLLSLQQHKHCYSYSYIAI